MSTSILPESMSCTKCRVTKPSTEFLSRRKSHSGLTTTCMECRNHVAALKKAYRASEKGKATAAAYNKKYADENAERLHQYRVDRYRAQTPEEKQRIAEITKASRLRNKDATNERRRQKLQTGGSYRDKATERSKQWYAANKDYVAEKQKLYYRQNTAKVRANIEAYKKANPELMNALNRVKVHRRRERIKGSSQHFNRQDIERLLALQRCKCANCGKSLKYGYHIDHRVPIAKGGDNGPGNIELLCRKCNYAKGAKLPHVFAQENGRLL